MILKKPYAFIIRHFRAIHLTMLACIAFLMWSASDISDFFHTLQATNTYTYPDAVIYVNNIVYIVALILLFLVGIVYWLLTEKKKPTKLYLYVLAYTVFVIVGYALLFYLLRAVSEGIIESEQVILGKDVAVIITYPGYFAAIICFIRGIGFNLKQFNFSKDIEELEIVDKDSEEFEVLIGKNNYKYFRLIRRTIREAKYYLLENIFVLKCIAGVIVIMIIGYGIYYYNNYLKELKSQESSIVDGISYTVRNSYITSKDYNGYLVQEDYKFIVIDMSFHNLTEEPIALDLKKISLSYRQLVYYPVLNRNSRFYDLGAPYTYDEKIKPGETLDATLTFRVPSSMTARNFKLRVRSGIDSSGNNILERYKLFTVSAKRIDEDNTVFSKSVNETINTNAVGINTYSLTIRGFALRDSYDNKYVLCRDTVNCTILSKVIIPDKKSENTMLVIDYEDVITDDAVFTKKFDTTNKIFANYCLISYKIGTKVFTQKADIVSNSNVDNKVFINVDRKILGATDYTLTFNFRDNTFIIKLK